MRVYTIGSTAPLGEADSVLARDQKTVFTHNEFGKAQVPRDRIWVAFRRQATLEQRQAALDAIDGTVIGGSTLGTGRNYYVQLPPSGTVNSLLAAIRKVEAMPMVQAASIHILNNLIGPAAVRGVDA